MRVSSPLGCSFVEAGRQTKLVAFADPARVHPNPFPASLGLHPSRRLARPPARYRARHHGDIERLRGWSMRPLEVVDLADMLRRVRA